MIKEHINWAISSIISNKMRSSLSMLWIIIWVFSIIVMLAIWEWASKTVVEKFSSMWANLITISPNRATGWGVWAQSKSSSSNIIDDAFIEYVKNIAWVKSVSPSVTANKQFIYGTYNSAWQITGVDENYAKLKSLTVDNWVFLSLDDINEANKVIVIGKDLASSAFGTQDPVWKEVKLENMIFTVVWVLADNSQNNTKIFAPVSTIMKKISWSHYYSSLSVEVEEGYDPNLMKTYITNELLSYLKISSADDATFSVNSMSEILSSITQVTGTLTALLAWIAAISLIVWGIGVMNIMLVSVTERTKEIGIRKAIWATRYDILAQFLIEALIISIVAWILWILLSFTVVAVIKNFTNAVITMKSMYLSFFAVVSIGIIFGILPARKAANLRPIDALRFE